MEVSQQTLTVTARPFTKLTTKPQKSLVRPALLVLAGLVLFDPAAATAQLIDNTLSPHKVNGGINKSFLDQAGAGRGNMMMPDSSMFIIRRDPFRSIRRGRQLFQRKFTRADGQGPVAGDGVGDLSVSLAVGAGLADSCASCHGRPRGSAGFGGDVATRPDSRDAPHLFGLGLKEMLADEITADLRAIRSEALAEAKATGKYVVANLTSKGIQYGSIAAYQDGTVKTEGLQGIDKDLRVKPFFAHGATISIREFIIGAFNDEMGLQAVDSDTGAASRGAKVTTPSGMVLDGSADLIKAPPVNPADYPTPDPDGDGVINEIPESVIDHFEFYLLNYFKPGTYEQTTTTQAGRQLMDTVGCTSCHVADLEIKEDRRVADVETQYDATQGAFNRLFATATPLYNERRDGSGYAVRRTPKSQPFLVKNIFTDFKRHDLGYGFHERNYDGTMQNEFLTTPLWGVGSTPPYGHDGRSINLNEVILRHGGEAQASRDSFAALSQTERDSILAFLNSLIIFPPDDTASNLDPSDSTNSYYPQAGHGSIKLGALFNDPTDPE